MDMSDATESGRDRDKSRRGTTRRTFLRGAGVTMALPWLESVPVWGGPAAGASMCPKRFAALFMACGINGNLLSGAALQKGAELKGGVSIDQVLADKVGQETVQPSLVLGCEQPTT